MSVAEAKEWWWETFRKSSEYKKLNPESEFAQNITAIGNSTTITELTTKLTKLPHWPKAKQYKVGNIEVVEVPLVYSKKYSKINTFENLNNDQIKKIKSNKLERLILFRKPQSAKIEIRIITYVPSYDFLMRNNFDISFIQSFKEIPNYGGSIEVRQWDETTINQRIFKNGKLLKYWDSKYFVNKISKRKNSVTKRSVPTDLPPCPESEPCEDGTSVFQYEITDYCLAFEEPTGDQPYDNTNPNCLDTYTQICLWSICIPNDSDDPNDPDPFEPCINNTAYASYEECFCAIVGCVSGGGNGTGGTTPYVMPASSVAIWNQIDLEDNADNNTMSCKGTKMRGNINFQGTLEHWLIQLDYIATTPAAVAEFQIPGASSTGSGWHGRADIANQTTGELFEIKPEGSGAITGPPELANYIAHANLSCPLPNNQIWKGGFYAPRLIPNPKVPNSFIFAQPYLNTLGVILYKTVLLPPANSPVPIPVAVPVTFVGRLKELVDKLKADLGNFQSIISEYLGKPQNADLVAYIKGAALTAAVAIIVGTLVEDICSGGWGVLDDVQHFALAYKIVRFAWKLP